jgi:hypothetical protein
MNRWLGHGGLAVLVSVGIQAAALRAQDRETLPSPTPPASYAVEPAVVAPPHGGDWVSVEAPRDPHEWHGPVCTWLRGLGCWSHHNCHCCGNLRSEYTFIFGSCKAFYGEPCLKAPPPMLVPAGYAAYPGSGYIPTCPCGH